MFWSSYPTVSVENLNKSYDYIIIGGGTAGCVLANRLSQDPKVSVLVIERGQVSNSWSSTVPLLSSDFASDRSRSSLWETVPQAHVNKRAIQLVTGNSLGGASKVNAMLYTRGLPGEFNLWESKGNQGWDYETMEKYFVKSEKALDQDPNNVEKFHGVSGEWQNRSHKIFQWGHTKHIIEAAKALGLPYVNDLNSPLQPSHGCAKMHYTIDSLGRRSSTFASFLPKSLVKQRKESLHICVGSIIRRIEIVNDGDSAKAEGVWVQAASGNDASKFIRAKREIVVSSGPLCSPQILMLSGIGPSDHLKEHGITVRKDLPGVGSHLQDHLAIPTEMQVRLQDSMTILESRPWMIIKLLFFYLVFGTGLLLSPMMDVSIFVQSRLFSGSKILTPSKDHLDSSRPENLPDFEIMPITWGNASIHRQGGFSFYNTVLRPTSEGTVRLASSNPTALPIIDPNYLSTENDWDMARKCLRFALRLRDQFLKQGYPVRDSLSPSGETDAELDEYIIKECRSAFHYSSTCHMASEADGGVVDAQLRVHGVQNLRVADSSIFPNNLSAHLQAATVAVAEKCSDMIITYYKNA